MGKVTGIRGILKSMLQRRSSNPDAVENKATEVTPKIKPTQPDNATTEEAILNPKLPIKEEIPRETETSTPRKATPPPQPSYAPPRGLWDRISKESAGASKDNDGDSLNYQRYKAWRGPEHHQVGRKTPPRDATSRRAVNCTLCYDNGSYIRGDGRKVRCSRCR